MRFVAKLFVLFITFHNALLSHLEAKNAEGMRYLSLLGSHQIREHKDCSSTSVKTLQTLASFLKTWTCFLFLKHFQAEFKRWGVHVELVSKSKDLSCSHVLSLA